MASTLKLLTYVSLASTIYFSSCKKEDAPGGGNNSNTEGVISAKVDGIAVSTESITGAANLVESVGTLTMQGNTGGTSSKTFQFTVNGFQGTGVYIIGGNNTVAVSASYTEMVVSLSNPGSPQSQTWQAPYSGGAEVGKITITDLSSNNVKGTFEFTAKNNNDNSMKTITEGTINLKLKRH